MALLKDLHATKELAENLAGELGPRALVLLDGPMGAGKTQFAKYLVEALGSSTAQSPSFAIHNSYESARGEIEHFDLYRLESEEDLESTGFWDFFAREKGIVLIEWALRLNEFGLRDQLPLTWPTWSLQFSFFGEGQGTERNVSVVRPLSS